MVIEYVVALAKWSASWPMQWGTLRVEGIFIKACEGGYTPPDSLHFWIPSYNVSNPIYQGLWTPLTPPDS